MSDPVQAEAVPGEVAESPDPLALASRVARKARLPAAGLVAVLAALGIVFRHSLGWGDVATWVVAITTLLAFLAAAFAGLVAYDLLRVENARDLNAAQERLLAAADRQRAGTERAAQRDADRRAQAGKVTAWFERFRHPERPYQMENATTWGAAVSNASELPVFDVRVFFYWVNRPRAGGTWTTEQRYASVDEEQILVIPPGQTRHLELPGRVCQMADECNDQVYLVGIEFTDANGTGWYRDERGALHERGPSAA